jgi:hypothetical protein
MFKHIDTEWHEVRLRHIPEGHIYIFPVRVVRGQHILDLGEIAQNPQSTTAAYKYARQAREFAMTIATELDYRLELLPIGEPAAHVEQPSEASTPGHHEPPSNSSGVEPVPAAGSERTLGWARIFLIIFIFVGVLYFFR